MSDQRAHQRLANITQQLTGSNFTHGLIPISTSSTATIATSTSTSTSSSSSSSSPKPVRVQLHGGIMAARALQEQGVKTVFTLTGGHIAPILVGCNQQGIRVVDVRDEATTVFAADAVARLTGIPGVAIVTAGPGLTNTITAVKNAQMAQSPVIVCAGATAMILKGRGSLQDIDQFALMKPHVKSMQTITAVKEIIPAFRRAFRIAQEGVPGPCFIEFPLETIWAREQIASQILGAKTPTFAFNLPSLMAQAQHMYLTRHIERVFKDAYVMPGAVNLQVIPPQPDVAAIGAVARALAASSRPIILVGSQAIRAGQTDDLRAALQRLNVPCYLSGMARGLLGASHPLQMRHKRGNALAKADFVLLLGVHADFRLDYGRHINGKAYFATVNLCPVTLRKNNDVRRPSLRVLGDSIAFIRRLADSTPTVPDRSGWFTTLQALQEKREKEIDEMAAAGVRAEVADENANFLDPIKLCRAIDAALDEKSILIADGGDFVGTASYIVRPRGPLTWLDPGVFGTLGVGGGFAMGAKAVHPDSEVWILFGDGSSGWSLTEFDTYVRNKLPVIAVIGNDACWSQMYRDQIRLLHDPVATELAYTDYHVVAQGLGAKGILVRRESELAGALQQAKTWAKQGHPVIVNALISKSAFREGSISL